MCQWQLLSVNALLCALYLVPPLAVCPTPCDALQDGTTPLHLAASRGSIVAMQLLIRHGARVNTRRHDGETALFQAAAAGRILATKVLLQQGADPGEQHSVEHSCQRV